MKNTRGIEIDFAEAFKKSVIYKLYKEHKSELIIGVRNNYLNLYYNCDSIAKIEYKNNSISCEIDKYYLDGKHSKDKEKTEEICNNYDGIKKRSNNHGKEKKEKKAQSILFIKNNENESSNWFCIDIEYAKSHKNKVEKEKAGFNGRFDIIAISKKIPHQVALIELKYGNGAIGGKNGIYKHIEDDYEFCKKGFFESQLKQEIVNIIKSLKYVDIDIPFKIPELSDILPNPDFYFITLDNNAENNASTPKQTIAGYLFEDKRWGCKRLTTKSSVQSKFGDVTDKNNAFHATFLFSTETLEKGITINDIIDGNYDEKI